MKEYIRKVNYYECDRMGITHHSNYIRFMEEARIDLMEQLGYGLDRMEQDGIVSPVVSLQCDYKKPTTFGDEIHIVVKLKSLSSLKLSFSYEMTVGGVIVCLASSTHCFMENGRPVVITDRFPALLAQFAA